MLQEFEYVVLIVGSLAVTALLSYILRKLLAFFIRKNTQYLDADPTGFVFLKNAVPTVLFTICIIWIFTKIPYFRHLGTALFAGAGVLAAVIGFASQKAFSNIIGGIFILIFKPFHVGDTIELSSSKKGVVESITLRHTIIRDYEFRRVVIPNSTISDDTIINSSLTDDKIRKQIEFSIAYDADVDLAMSVIKEQIKNHPFFIDNRSQEQIADGVPDLDVRVVSLGDFAVVLRAFVWAIDNDHAFKLTTDSYKSVKAAFDQSGIEIPFPYRTIVQKKDI